MDKAARQKQIVELLQNKGHVEVEGLCRMFNVTNMTIRRISRNLRTPAC